MRLSYYSSLTLQMTGAIHLQANDIDLETRQQHHTFVYRSRKRSWHQIWRTFSYCCLPLLPQFVNIILATWGSLFWGPLYSIHTSQCRITPLFWCIRAVGTHMFNIHAYHLHCEAPERAICSWDSMWHVNLLRCNSPFTKMMSIIWHWRQKRIG